jgi:sugar fermentation stimulation protein A
MAGAKECIILKRINRFTAAISLGSSTWRAYISNTGRLVGYLSRGRRGFCVRQREGLRTDFRLFAVREGSLAAVIDTQLQMKTLEKIIELALIPWLKPSVIRKRDAWLGRSRIDYLLEHLGEKVYLEVKSAVLRCNGYAMYPDCPSMRGRRHIAELTEHVKKGGRGLILFIAALPGVEAFKPNSSADPEISRLLLAAAEAGVDIRAIGLFYNPEDSYVYLSKPDLPVHLCQGGR